MSRKSSYTVEEKIKACADYLSGLKSASQIAIELNMGKRGRNVVCDWAKKYKAYGASVFINKSRNNCYSQEFKERVVKEYLNGTSSPNELIIKYNIPSRTTLVKWIKMYNNHKELKSYKLSGGMIMRKGRKTTYDERIEIVEYCLKNGLDYIDTANEYEVSYQQVYSWISKYNDKGIIALKDNRGRGKSLEDMDEVEKLRAENKLLKAKIERFEIEEELKKKVQGVETRLVYTTRRKK